MNKYSRKIRIFAHVALIVAIWVALTGRGAASAAASFLAPFIWAMLLRDASKGAALTSSFVFGFGGWMAGSWWLAQGISAMNSNYWWAGYLSVATLAAIAGAPYVFSGWLFHRLRVFESKRPRPFFAAAIVSLSVDLCPNPFPGSLVNGVNQVDWLLQILDFGGVLFAHTVIFSSAFSFGICLQSTTPRAYRLKTLVTAVLMIGAVFTYSAVRRERISQQMESAAHFRVGIVQPNIPIKHGEHYGFSGSLESLGQQTKSLLAMSPAPDLVVWPEIPLYFSPFNAPDDRQFLDHLLTGSPIPLLVSADMFANERRYDRIPYYNVVQLVRGGGEVLAEYRKMLLVPMGEYLPFEEYLSGPYAKDFLRDVRRYAPGREVSVIGVSPTVTVGTPICLEMLHSQHVGEMVRRGANLLINPSNDAYFGKSPGVQLNATYARMRAIEYRIPVVRVTNSGISVAFNQLGEIIADTRLPEFEQASALAEVSIFGEARENYLLPCHRGLLFISGLCIVSLLWPRPKIFIE